jgi:hypothetical protein
MMNLGDCGVREEITGRVIRVIPGHAGLWGRMSAHQMICHLADTFRLATGEKRSNLVGRRIDQTVVKWVALYVPAPWPKGFSTRPEFEQGAGGTPPATYEGDRKALLDVMERFAGLERIAPAHPVFGRLTRGQWMRWGYLHADHHLRQFGA